MWITIYSNLLLMGHKQFFGHNANQKKHFGCDFLNVGNIVVGKSNSNFVDKYHHTVHSCIKPVCPELSFNNISYINSDQSIVQNTKENELHIVEPIEFLDMGLGSSETSGDKLMMCKKRKNRIGIRNKKSRSLKKKEKNTKNRTLEINEMIEVYMDPDFLSNKMDININSVNHHCLTLSDYIYKKSLQDLNEIENENKLQNLIHLISPSARERSNSVAESEDSFVVFESGTDDDLDESGTDDDQDESGTDDNSGLTDDSMDSLDLYSSVVPKKKVQFASASELCQIHPMITWSYAYQKARIGPWQRYAIDRLRFKDHITILEEKLKPILDAAHRKIIFQERFQNLEHSQL